MISGIDVSVNIYADLFEIITDHLQQFVINISVTHDEKKIMGDGKRERARERERKEKPWDIDRFCFGHACYAGTKQCALARVFSAKIY